MCDTTVNLHHKIIGAGELQTVVRTMKAAAATKITQFEKSVNALAGYYHTVELGLGVYFRQGIFAPLFARETKQMTLAVINAIVFGSDQGLVGRFNDIITDHAVKTLAVFPGRPQVWAVGEYVYEQLIAAGLPVVGLFEVPNSVKAITALVGQILVDITAYHEQDKIHELHLFYNRPVSGAAYTAVNQQLLPLDDNWQYSLVVQPWPTRYIPEIISDSNTTLRALIGEYLFVSLFRACAESLASENASRLAAMQHADKNIEELLRELTVTFHRLRQDSIDEELFEVISGFEALSAEEKLSAMGSSSADP
jgi:F-type H+-transporting ATPase subunit gamma